MGVEFGVLFLLIGFLIWQMGELIRLAREMITELTTARWEAGKRMPLRAEPQDERQGAPPLGR
jgi:hypothetical protein